MAYLYKLNIVINEEEENLQIENEIEESIEDRFGKANQVEIVGARVIELDNSICGKCHYCGAWTSDLDNPEHIAGFSDGCIVDGVWVCDLCLPKDHPKAF